jgi:ribosomal protein S18 acetylase RimI-like enzyme
MQPPFTTRKSLASDGTACAKIIRVWGEETPWIGPLDDLEPMANFWAELLETEFAWVAEQAGEVVGFCVREDDNITGLYVASEARSQGVGKALLDLAKADRDWITVWVYEKNTRAQTFYAREGLVEIGRELDEDSPLMYVETRWRRAG